MLFKLQIPAIILFFVSKINNNLDLYSLRAGDESVYSIFIKRFKYFNFRWRQQIGFFMVSWNLRGVNSHKNLCFPQHLTSFHSIWYIGLVFFSTMNWTTTKQKPQKLTEITMISFGSDLVKYYQICDLFNPWNIWLNFHMLNSILRKS